MSAIQSIIQLARRVETETGAYPRFVYMDDTAVEMVIDEMNWPENVRPVRLTKLAGMIVMPAHNFPKGTVFVTMEPL